MSSLNPTILYLPLFRVHSFRCQASCWVLQTKSPWEKKQPWGEALDSPVEEVSVKQIHLKLLRANLTRVLIVWHLFPPKQVIQQTRWELERLLWPNLRSYTAASMLWCRSRQLQRSAQAHGREYMPLLMKMGLYHIVRAQGMKCKSI